MLPPLLLILAGVDQVVLSLLLLSHPGVHQLPAVLDAEDDLVTVVLHLSVERVLWVCRRPVVVTVRTTKLIGIGVRIFL